MTNVTTTSQVNDAVGVWYNKSLLDPANPLLIANQFGQMKSIPKGSSKTVRYSRFEKLSEATTALTEGVEPNGQALDVTRMDATCQQYGDFIVLTDVVELTVSDPVANQANKRLGEQMGETLETLTYDVLKATASYYNCADGADGGTPTELTQTDIDTNVQTLMNNDAKMYTEIMSAGSGFGTAPLDQSYYAISNTAVYRDLKDVDSWVPRNQYPQPASVKQGERGYTDNVRWCLSSHTPTTGTGSSKQFYTFLLSRDAFGVVDIATGNSSSIFIPPGGTGDRLKQRSSLGWKAWHACKILNDDYIIRVMATITQ